MPRPTYLCVSCGEQMPGGARWCPNCKAPAGDIQSSVEGTALAERNEVPVTPYESMSHTGQSLHAALGLPTSRWGATVSTFGPLTKLVCTAAALSILLPAFALMAGLTPFAALGVVWGTFWAMWAVPFLVSMWKRGRQDAPEVPPTT